MAEQNPLLSNVEDKMAGQDGGGKVDVTQANPTGQRSSRSHATFASALVGPSGQPLPQAIAHRGYKAAYPENTMGAFRGAVEIGAHALETDVHITKDEVIVLSHDATLKRCFGLEDKVIDCDWKFLETLETLKEPRQKMPRLKDLLQYMATPGLEDIWLLLDIKLDNDADQVMRLIASTIKEVPPSPTKPWNQRILLGIWAAKYIPLSTQYLPTYPTTHIGFSIPYARHFLTDTRLAHEPPTSFNMMQKVLVGPFGSSFLKDIKNRKDPRDIFAWTVNEKTWMEWSIEKKVDGVVTDDPKLFLEVCRDWEKAEVKDRRASLRWRDVWGVVYIHFLIMTLGTVFWWKNPAMREGLGKKPQSQKKKVPSGRIAI